MNSLLSEIGRGAGDALRILARKDLKKPANLNAFIDLLLWLVVILLALFCPQLKSPSTMFYMAFILTLICMGWFIFHYTVMLILRRR